MDDFMSFCILQQKSKHCPSKTHHAAIFSLEFKPPTPSVALLVQDVWTRTLSGDRKSCPVSEVTKRSEAALNELVSIGDVKEYLAMLVASLNLCIGEEVLETLKWWLSAYSMVLIVDERAVRLRQRIGAGETGRGFLIEACRDLEPGEYIYELSGSTSRDASRQNTHLSEIFGRKNSFFCRKTPYLLVGPIRFVNHECVNANAEYVYVTNSGGFIIQITKPVPLGHEVLVNYGKSYFDTDCPCPSCKSRESTRDIPKASVGPTPYSYRPKKNIAEVALKQKDRRERRKQRREKKEDSGFIA